MYLLGYVHRDVSLLFIPLFDCQSTEYFLERQVSIGNILLIIRDGKKVGVLMDLEYAKKFASMIPPHEFRTVRFFLAAVFIEFTPLSSRAQCNLCLLKQPSSAIIICHAPARLSTKACLTSHQKIL